MAYFLGRDVEVAITTENTEKGLDYSNNGSAVTVASGVSGTGMLARGGGSGSDGADDDDGAYIVVSQAETVKVETSTVTNDRVTDWNGVKMLRRLRNGYL